MVLLSIITFFGCLFTAINHGYYSFLYLIYTFIHLSLVVLLFKNRVSEKIPIAIFYMFFCFVLFQYAHLKDINDIFPESSRNTVSWIGLVLCSLYYLLSILNDKEAKNPFPLFVLLVLCIFSQGRSGIIASLILLTSHYLFNFTRNTKIWIQVSKNILLMLLFLAIIFKYSGTFDDNLKYFQNRKFDDKGRQTILSSYWKAIDYVSIFTGVKIDNIAILKKFHSNPHNSYVSCHIKYGIMAIILIGYLLFALIRGAANRCLYFLTSVYGCILLRIFTDRLAFIGNFDFLIYFATILIYQKSRNAMILPKRTVKALNRLTMAEESKTQLFEL